MNNNNSLFKYKKMIAIPVIKNSWNFDPITTDFSLKNSNAESGTMFPTPKGLCSEVRHENFNCNLFENIKKKLKEQDKILSLVRAGIIMVVNNEEDFNETKFLLVMGKSGIWSFPKGISNCNESSMNCAIRELYEETGIDIKNERLNEENKCKIGKNLYYILKVKEEITDFDIKDKKEIEKVEWIKFKDLKDMNINRDLRNIIIFPERKFAYHHIIFD